MFILFKKNFLFLILLLFTSGCISAQQTSSLSVVDRFNSFNNFINSISPAKISLTEPDRAERVRKKFDHLFLGKRNSIDLKFLSDEDIHLLFRASSFTAFFVGTKTYIDYALTDFNIIKTRSIVREDEALFMYGILITARMYDQAHELAQSFDNYNFEPVPNIVDARKSSDNVFSLYETNNDSHSLRLENFELSKNKQIIVISHPLCHFSQDAISDIESNAFTKKIFDKYSIWLAPPTASFSIPSFQNWNRIHPNESIAIAVQKEDWPMIANWATPDIYFLNNGKVVDTMHGWHQGHDINLLIQKLKSNSFVE